ncbi:ser/Thr protein phosphatase-like protein superfamily, partial [Halenospora varia]
MQHIRPFFNKSQPRSFQIVSDLHLEVGKQYNNVSIPPSAPFLILAGDIGCLADYDAYLSFLARQTTSFETVFLILGNHEFFGLSLVAGLEQARRLENEEVFGGKLVLLHQKRFDIPGSSITILGCTLWSEIDGDAREIVRAKVKDFSKIGGRTLDEHNADHESDLTWLRTQIEEIRKENEEVKTSEERKQILVVTHHAPSMQETARPEQVNNPWSSAFATDILKEGEWENVKLWVFGHTHFSTEFEKFGVKVVSNQRGYVLPGMAESKDKNFDV